MNRKYARNVHIYGSYKKNTCQTSISLSCFLKCLDLTMKVYITLQYIPCKNVQLIWLIYTHDVLISVNVKWNPLHVSNSFCNMSFVTSHKECCCRRYCCCTLSVSLEAQQDWLQMYLKYRNKLRVVFGWHYRALRYLQD